MTTEWKPIPMLKGMYEVSCMGDVRRAVGGKRTKIGRVIKPQWRGRTNIYKIFTPTLGSNASKRTVSIAECVLDAFKGPRPSECEPDHIDGNEQNDHIDNLQWLHWSKNRPGRPLGSKDRRPRK